MRLAVGKRTLLVSDANYRILRIYCASHVLEEVEEHAFEWALDRGIEFSAVTRAWRDSLLPLIRVVELPLVDLFSESERARLEILHNRDSDDIPTAKLALLVGARVLSRDRRLLECVYGPDIDYDGHVDWLDKLSALGDLAVLDSSMQFAFLLGANIFEAVWSAAVSIAKRLPTPILLSALAMVAIGYRQFVPPERRSSFLAIIMDLGKSLGQVFIESMEFRSYALDRFRALAEPQSVPRMAINDGMYQKSVLLRSSIYYLARNLEVGMSAAELKDEIDLHLGRAFGSQSVRTELQGSPSFVEIARGRYQLGGTRVNWEREC